MNDLIDNLGITNLDGEAAVSSLSVAKAFGKRHSDVLKRIRALDRHTDFCTRNFKPGTYRDRRGMPHPLVVMTCSGFLLWLTSLKGSKDVMRIAEAYLMTFEAMEQRQRGAAGNEPRAGEMDATGDTRDLLVYSFEGHSMRVVLQDSEPWWVAKDVLEVLGLDTSHGVRDLEDDEKALHIMETLGGSQKMAIINLSGFYKLIFRSRKTKAKEITRWVTHEVLPSIHRRGYYISPKAQNVSPAALEALTASVTQITTAVTELARRMVDLADVLAAVARRQDDVERRCAALERRLQGSPQPRPETAQIPLFTEPRELLTEARKALDKPAREPLVPPDIETKRPYTGIGVRLRRLRQHLDRTPDELAAMIRMSGGAYKNVELGINRPSLLTLTKLREATGVSADWLLFGHGAMFGAERDAE